MTQPCPRLEENPMLPVLKDEFKQSSWRVESNTCSYCGSMHPDDVFKAFEAGETLIPTDKSYKIYVRADGGNQRKFYFQHFSPDEQIKFLELVNAKKIKFARPGGFYVLPFFCQKVTA